jgi:hypothetical protein
LRFIPSLTGALLVACLLPSSPLPALSQNSKVKSTKPAQAKWDPSKISRKISLGSRAARQALSYRGVPYHFGGRTRKGIDCSGLIQTTYKKWGILLPRTSVEQYKRGVQIPKQKMKAGDLVFFKNTYKRGISHVGIYMGQNQFVHASSGRGQVTVSSLNDPYYLNHWAGARRIALNKEPVYAQTDTGDAPPATKTIAWSDQSINARRVEQNVEPNVKKPDEELGADTVEATPPLACDEITSVSIQPLTP